MPRPLGLEFGHASRGAERLRPVLEFEVAGGECGPRVGIITVVGKPVDEQSNRFFGVSPLEKLLCGPRVLFAAVQRTHPYALVPASTRWSHCTLNRLG